MPLPGQPAPGGSAAPRARARRSSGRRCADTCRPSRATRTRRHSVAAPGAPRAGPARRAPRRPSTRTAVDPEARVRPTPARSSPRERGPAPRRASMRPASGRYSSIAPVASSTIVRRPDASSSVRSTVTMPSTVTRLPSRAARPRCARAAPVAGRRRGGEAEAPGEAAGWPLTPTSRAVADPQAVPVERALARRALADDARERHGRALAQDRAVEPARRVGEDPERPRRRSPAIVNAMSPLVAFAARGRHRARTVREPALRGLVGVRPASRRDRRRRRPAADDDEPARGQPELGLAVGAAIVPRTSTSVPRPGRHCRPARRTGSPPVASPMANSDGVPRRPASATTTPRTTAVLPTGDEPRLGDGERRGGRSCCRPASAWGRPWVRGSGVVGVAVGAGCRGGGRRGRRRRRRRRARRGLGAPSARGSGRRPGPSSSPGSVACTR